MTRRAARVLAALAFLLLLAVGLRLLVTTGSLEIPQDWTVLTLRAQRIVSAIAVGGALAVSGVILQSMLRNSLASEYILGLSSGAGLGLVVWLYISYRLTGGIIEYNPPVIAPIIGATAALALVYALSQRRGMVEPASLILVGVIVGIVCSAFTSLFQHLLPDGGLAVYSRYLLGNLLDDVSQPRLWSVLSITACGTVVAAMLGRSFDAASLGPDEAATVGVNLGRLRIVSFLLAGILTGSTILLAGPIGFVGLICPHLVRRLAGANHRVLFIGSALAGATLLLVADSAVSFVSFAAGHMPIGVVTALIGGQVFIFMLRSRGPWMGVGGTGSGGGAT